MSITDNEMQFIHRLMGHLMSVGKIKFYALAHDYTCSLRYPYILQTTNNNGEIHTLKGEEIWDAIRLDAVDFLINYENRIPIGGKNDSQIQFEQK